MGEVDKLKKLWCKTLERKTYPIGNKGDEVVPEDVQNQKQCHQKVKNVINREHLNKLGRQKRIKVKIFKQSEKNLSCLWGGWVNDPRGEDSDPGVGPGQAEHHKGNVTASLVKSNFRHQRHDERRPPRIQRTCTSWPAPSSGRRGRAPWGRGNPFGASGCSSWGSGSTWGWSFDERKSIQPTTWGLAGPGWRGGGRTSPKSLCASHRWTGSPEETSRTPSQACSATKLLDLEIETLYFCWQKNMLYHFLCNIHKKIYSCQVLRDGIVALTLKYV